MNSSVLLQSEQRPIILKGTHFTAVWDGKTQEFIADSDKVVMNKGTYDEFIELNK
ncbi:MAG: hypothetical protein ABFD76_11560 [Smithella sp.]